MWHEHKPNFLYVRSRLLSHWKKNNNIRENKYTRQILISHEREYTIFSLNVCFFTYLEPLEDLDLHTGLETRPVVSWAPREVLHISIRIIRKLMGAGGNTLFNANPEGSGGGGINPCPPPHMHI